jgi:hypothetical protein
VAVLCEVFEVSRSGFYAYLHCHAIPSIDRAHVELVARVKAIAVQTGQSYGSRRMAKQLQAEGYALGRYKARQLMQEAGVTVCRPTHRRPLTTNSCHGSGIAPNLLARQFDVEQPDQVWVGDITYLGTAEGWLCLAVLLDLYSRKVVGWAMSAHIDATLVQTALQMALGRRQPAPGLLHHTPTVSLGVTSAVACTYGCGNGRIGPTRCAVIGGGLGDSCSQCRVCSRPPAGAHSAHSGLAAASRLGAPVDPRWVAPMRNHTASKDNAMW